MKSNNLTSYYSVYANRYLTEIRRYKSLKKSKWSNLDSRRILLITENNRISRSQISPFYYYAADLYEKWNVEFIEVNIDLLKTLDTGIISSADTIFVQAWFQKGEDKIVSLLEHIKLFNLDAKIVFFDSFAPLDLRLARPINPYIDLYVKKHIFKDRAIYKRATKGDTNLVEYYHDLYGLDEMAHTNFKVPEDFYEKLFLGPSFFTSNKMLSKFESFSKPLSHAKNIDIHARLCASGNPWYQKMREHALQASSGYKSTSIITSLIVGNSKYMKELQSSRICFSPFGYGEVCWRDYEAVMSGSMLVKPDMSHVDTAPDIFIPFVTYVPVKWDYSDLSEKLAYYLENLDEREKIIQAAYSQIHTYLANDGFVKQTSVLFE